jgi:hypothetical protein
VVREIMMKTAGWKDTELAQEDRFKYIHELEGLTSEIKDR